MGSLEEIYWNMAKKQTGKSDDQIGIYKRIQIYAGAAC